MVKRYCKIQYKEEVEELVQDSLDWAEFKRKLLEKYLLSDQLLDLTDLRKILYRLLKQQKENRKRLQVGTDKDKGVYKTLSDMREMMSSMKERRLKLQVMMTKAKTGKRKGKEPVTEESSSESESEEERGPPQHATTVHLDRMEGVPPDKFYILGSGTVETILNDEVVLHGVIDNGSEAVIIDEERAVRLGLDLDRSYLFEIETANGRKQKIFGVCHNVAIEVEGLRVLMPVFAVRNCSSDLLLGRTWLSHVHAVTVERSDGSQMLSIKHPDGGQIMIETVEPRDPRNRAALADGGGRKPVTLASRSLRFCEKKYGALLTEEEGRIVEIEDLGNRVLVGENSYLKDEDEEFLRVFFKGAAPYGGRPKKHKAVTQKVKLVAVARE
ncbi:hypothetical protein CBR_g16086 [Chara braunii]|uniref:Peptidase A2 domain-containing protein n=1 Tax=Chara braunii TaxID=69332 RepID=A0A388KTI1_CHABU|nr:hypothetical protein CBR_g16086 [Chara braunii]|eukprot:GBG73371.1 hypothetical protein CBR_g16086 [Chara braunii]